MLPFPTVLRETLETRGVMGKLKAQIRAEVYKALDDQVSFDYMHKRYVRIIVKLSLIQILHVLT